MRIKLNPLTIKMGGLKIKTLPQNKIPTMDPGPSEPGNYHQNVRVSKKRAMKKK